MASGDSNERADGLALATHVWERTAADDQLDDWLRRECGPAALEMAYDAGLRVNGRVTSND